MQLQSLCNVEVQVELVVLCVDLMVVVVYGLILFQVVFDILCLGCINSYVLLLLCWCGVVLIQCVVEVGDVESGVIVMQMEVGFDIGLMLFKVSMLIFVVDIGGSLYDWFVVFGLKVVVEVIVGLVVGILYGEIQDDVLVIYVYKLNKDEVCFDWSCLVVELECQVCVFIFWLVCYISFVDVLLKVFGVSLGQGSGVFGIIFEVSCDGLLVVCGEGVLCLICL